PRRDHRCEACDQELDGGKRIALIVNEFGDAGVDGDLVTSCGLEGCAEEDVIELANGCICCTVADDFIPTLTALIERETPPDHIVIETSGLALPQPLLRAFAWPEVRARVTVDGVVTVIDSAAVADGRFASDEDAVVRQQAADDSLDHDSALAELFADQLSCADLVVLSKTDLVTSDALGTVIATVESEKRPQAAVVHATAKAPPPVAVLLGIAAAAETDAANRRMHHDHHHDDADHHDHDHDHDHDDFESFVVAMPEVADASAMSRCVSALGAAPGVLRIKGALAVTGKPMRLVVQAVGPRVETYFDRPWRADEGRDGKLVVIGLTGLDRGAIEGRLKDAAAGRAVAA
ncbi:MAG: cobalamin biosynthesis protein CobW, partial [Pseudomonadota bacterium]